MAGGVADKRAGFVAVRSNEAGSARRPGDVMDEVHIAAGVDEAPSGAAVDRAVLNESGRCFRADPVEEERVSAIAYLASFDHIERVFPRSPPHVDEMVADEIGA